MNTGSMRLIRELQDFICQQPTNITEFDETLVKRLISKITVFEDHFTRLQVLDHN